MTPRWAAKRDANQSALAEFAEGLGWRVYDTSPLAQYGRDLEGFADMIWICPHATVFVEAKTAKGTLTTGEQGFMHDVTDAGGEYRVVRSENDVLAVTRYYWPGRLTDGD